jgi:subtilisin-like proprotein convertase family protein
MIVFALGAVLFRGFQVSRKHSGVNAGNALRSQSVAVAGRGVSEEAPLRVSNTSTPLRRLLRSPTAILLENARLDTAQPVAGLIPPALRSDGEPGAYLVQSRGPPGAAFRARIHAAGAETVAYIPNNAYLVRASHVIASQLASDALVQAVLPFEPYYKLKGPLLEAAVHQGSLPEQATLSVLLFGPTPPSATAFAALGFDVLAEDASPFGCVVAVRPAKAGAADALAALARMPEVQGVELSRRRVFATDLARERIGVAFTSTAPGNYLNLTGTNVLVNVNDSGVDASHPDLTNRVFADAAANLVDTNGHGTHVAGIIAGSGFESLTVTNASGSVMPASPGQFRGMAPAARLFALAAAPSRGPASDIYLQQTAARTNAFISNNSWHYAGDYSYDLAAARYDAAVRDALPGVTGPQPLLFVFGAGNAGRGGADGSGGVPDSILSPATAKNVITVGAIDQARMITNSVYECAVLDETNNCVTNQPWLDLTYTDNVVAPFSSRGNVGVGVEGEFGRFKPDVVMPGTCVVAARSAQWNPAACCTPTNGQGNYCTVWSNLNNGVGPFYRYESGTSMSAAAASGTLALMQEFFERFGRTNSPALMKALLINGARPVAPQYDYQLTASTNIQGWGLVNLTNSIPAALSNLPPASSAMLVFDQSPDEALSTGESRTRAIVRSPEAASQPLRITLVWTDPPGNPAACLKLVNDLDLVVTNLSTGAVYLGNDFAPGNLFTSPRTADTEPDVVNNVENVYLPPGPGTHYSVTVVARNVNVNAVAEQSAGIAQDYALVISSGDGADPAALTLSGGGALASNAPVVVTLTNAFAPGSGVVGEVRLHERAGANSPFIGGNVPLPPGTNGVLTPGQTNQWTFYVISNADGAMNAAFATFQSVPIAIPQDANQGTNRTFAAVPVADIDLYVSTDPALLSLDPAALAAADRSVRRGGNEFICYTNALPATYYIGVKSESQSGGEYNFVGLFSQAPFGVQDETGAWVLQGLNLPVAVAAGDSSGPARTNVLAIAPAPIPVRRVVTTNEVAAQDFAGLTLLLTHGGKTVVLNSNSVPPGPPSDFTYIFEDNNEGDIAGARNSTGPGSERDFVGEQGQGLWILTVANSSLTETAAVENFAIRLEPQEISGFPPHVAQTNAFSYDFVDVPPGATNLSICVYNTSGIPLPVGLYVRRNAFPDLTHFDQFLPSVASADCVYFNVSSLPPLNAGRYYIGIYNGNGDPQTVALTASVATNPAPSFNAVYSSCFVTPIVRDAVTNATLLVTNRQNVAAVEVALHVDDPHVSDLVFTMVSPSGARVVLFENRGADTASGLGGYPVETNVFPVRSSGDFSASTNVLSTDMHQGVLKIDYNFYALPDTMHVYYDHSLIFDSGSVSNSGYFDIAFGPGPDTDLVVVMNEGNNEDTNTLWDYTASVVGPVFGNVVFTENTNRAQVPIKFAPAPFQSAGSNSTLYYLPEQTLRALAGESAFGQWQLEIRDARASGADPPGIVTAWQLRFLFETAAPAPVIIDPGASGTNAVPPGEIAYFAVEAPGWATFATNLLLSATAPINVLFNASVPPSGTNAGDACLLAGSTNDTVTLGTTGSVSFIPGTRYYLGVQNSNAFPVTASLAVNFDVNTVTVLSNATPYYTNSAGPAGALDYYLFTVSSNAVRAQFEIEGPTDDVTLIARRGGPLATLSNYQFISANPGGNEELIVVFKTSTPVPLAPGAWYISAVNTSGEPLDYTIMATEYPVYGTNVLITNAQYGAESFCLTWTSLAGVHYYIQGKAGVASTNWATVSPTILGAAGSTTWCVPLPSPYQFFRVHEGIAATPCQPQIYLTNIVCGSNGAALQWSAPNDWQFRVQYSPSLLPPAWADFTNIVVSTNGGCWFLDDGSQCGGMSPQRYYRVRLVSP